MYFYKCLSFDLQFQLKAVTHLSSDSILFLGDYTLGLNFRSNLNFFLRLNSIACQFLRRSALKCFLIRFWRPDPVTVSVVIVRGDACSTKFDLKAAVLSYKLLLLCYFWASHVNIYIAWIHPLFYERDLFVDEGIWNICLYI